MPENKDKKSVINKISNIKRKKLDQSEDFWAPEIAQDYFPTKSEEIEKQSDETKDQWLEEPYDGQLAVDVYQDSKNIIIKSTIAGVKPEDINISINNDMITIRGIRRMAENIPEEDYFYKECYWGRFSRSIILPVDIKADKVEATLENGILTIILPNAPKTKEKTIKVTEKK